MTHFSVEFLRAPSVLLEGEIWSADERIEMARNRDIVALMKSDATPVYEAALEHFQGVKGKTASSGEALRKMIYGIKPYDAALKWAETTSPTPKTINDLCDAFNEFLDSCPPAKEAVPNKLSKEVFAPETRRYEFAKALGFKGYCNKSKLQWWERAQLAIDTVLYNSKSYGREHSCKIGDVRLVKQRLAGLNYLYFKSYADKDARQTPLLRATLRIKEKVAISENADTYYVPCKMKVPVPVATNDRLEPVGYSGKVCIKKSKFLHFVMMDEANQSDFFHMTLVCESDYDDIMDGFLLTASTHGWPYTSAAVLEKRPSEEIQKMDMQTPDATLNFMNHQAQKFDNGIEGIPKNELDKRVSERLESRLANSPQR